MRYSHWVWLVSILNLAIIFTVSWCVFTLMSVVLSLQGGFQPDYTGQPLILILCLVFSVVNTPLIAFPIMKHPERLRSTMIYCVFLPFVVMIVGGLVGITSAIILTVP